MNINYCEYVRPTASSGERKVCRWLLDNGYRFVTEQTFNGLCTYSEKTQRTYPLRYDFAVYDGYDNIRALIEVDGQQHTGKSFLKVNHEKVRLHDHIKNNYAKENGIHLLRLNYYELSGLDEILGSFLHCLVFNNHISNVL